MVIETPIEAAVKTALRGIVDPETGRDLVAMGLIYGIEVKDSVARVQMTTTTKGCPLSELLRSGAQSTVGLVAGITAAHVELVYDPPWTLDRMEA